MKLALHRSVTFWSGILAMAFICWAWRDSTRASSFIVKDRWAVISVTSRAMVDYRAYSSPSEWKAGQLEVAGMADYIRVLNEFPLDWPRLVRGIKIEERMEFYEVGTVSGRTPNVVESCYYQESGPHTGGPSDWCLFIPYIVILTAIAAPWTVLLLWRARRRKRAEPMSG